jgi:hypothetical protein
MRKTSRWMMQVGRACFAVMLLASIALSNPAHAQKADPFVLKNSKESHCRIKYGLSASSWKGYIEAEYKKYENRWRDTLADYRALRVDLD